jgi:alkanesulfonate monooxygenase SsuD/methylene tetrahydromethanopterin reductase-like flavin-dependent oxidoreductase (luciferase family)
MSIPFFSVRAVKRAADQFKEQCAKQGYDAHPEQTSLNIAVFVGKTDAEAWERFESHFWYFQKNLLKGILDVNTPGYTSIKSTMGMVQHMGDFVLACQTRDDLERGGFVVVGSAETVRQRLSEMLRQLGTGNMLMNCHFGSMDAATYREAMDRFAADVTPKLRAEFAAQDAIPLPPPRPVFESQEAA